MSVWVCVWVCGCLGVWVFGCLGVWLPFQVPLSRSSRVYVSFPNTSILKRQFPEWIVTKETAFYNLNPLLRGFGINALMKLTWSGLMHSRNRRIVEVYYWLDTKPTRSNRPPAKFHFKSDLNCLLIDFFDPISAVRSTRCVRRFDSNPDHLYQK